MTVVQYASKAKPHSVEPGQQTAFTAFPECTLLELGKVPIAEIYDGTIKWDAVFVCRKGAQVPSATSDKAVVPRTAIKQAKQQASAYAEDLDKTRQIGFRDPDRLNLERAIIVASAVIAPAHPHLVPLSDALKTSSTGGR